MAEPAAMSNRANGVAGDNAGVFEGGAGRRRADGAMTARASAVEAAALLIEPRDDGGFGLTDPLTGMGVEVRRAADDAMRSSASRGCMRTR